jgi:hypothetical protein
LGGRPGERPPRPSTAGISAYLHLKKSIDEEVLQAEQARINEERAQAQRWADAASREVEDVEAALADALTLLDARRVTYHLASPGTRRLINQAIFGRLTIHDPDTIEAERTPLYQAIAQLTRDLEEAPQTGHNPQKRPQSRQDKSCAQDDHDPLLGGRGSYIAQMAGSSGRVANREALDQLLGLLLEPVGREARLRAAEAIRAVV